MLNGEHWLLGGWFYPNAIAKVEDCKISRQAGSLEIPFHGGMFGSCAAYNGKIWTCFDGKDGRARECQGTQRDSLGAQMASGDVPPICAKLRRRARIMLAVASLQLSISCRVDTRGADGREGV